MEQRIKKPTLTLRKNNPTPAPTPILQESSPREQIQHPQEYPDFNVERFPEWDIPVVEDVEPKRRKRRKDKHVEQYRKESRWQ
jgi:hypothetical protein